MNTILTPSLQQTVLYNIDQIRARLSIDEYKNRIISDLDVTHVIDYLKRHSILSTADTENLYSIDGRSRRAEETIRTIRLKDDTVVNAFMTALLNTGQNVIHDYIQGNGTEKEASAKTFYELNWEYLVEEISPRPVANLLLNRGLLCHSDIDEIFHSDNRTRFSQLNSLISKLNTKCNETLEDFKQCLSLTSHEYILKNLKEVDGSTSQDTEGQHATTSPAHKIDEQRNTSKDGGHDDALEDKQEVHGITSPETVGQHTTTFPAHKTDEQQRSASKDGGHDDTSEDKQRETIAVSLSELAQTVTVKRLRQKEVDGSTSHETEGQHAKTSQAHKIDEQQRKTSKDSGHDAALQDKQEVHGTTSQEVVGQRATTSQGKGGGYDDASEDNQGETIAATLREFVDKVIVERPRPKGKTITARLRESAETVTVERSGQKESIEDNRPKLMQATVKAWRQEKIYRTKGVAATQEKILSQDCVCVVGVPGAGKSTAIHHAALCLEDNGFIIYCIDEINEILQYVDEDKKQVFIIDDVLGIYSLDQGEVKIWDENNADITCILGTNTKLLLSIRTQLYNQAVKGNNFVFLDRSTCIDLSDETFRLDGDDMINMLTHFLTVQGIDKVDELIRQIYFPFWTEIELQDMTKEDRKRIISQYVVGREFSHCFPLLCKVFASEKFLRHSPREFFTNPFQALTRIFQKIKSDNKIQFCGLVLCTVLDGRLTEDMLSIDCEDNNEYDIILRDVIMKAFHLEGHLLEIKSGLDCLDGVYVTRLENTYKMANTVFCDVVTYLFNDTDPSFVLKFGTIEFILNRIRLGKTQPIDDPYMIIINDDKNIQRLTDRLFRDLKSDTETGADFIARNPNISDERLFLRLIRKLGDKEQTDKEMIDRLFRQCMRTVRHDRDKYQHGDVPLYRLIKFCVQTGVDCNMEILFGWYPLHISIMTGSFQLTQLLLHGGADIRRVVWGESVLHRVGVDTEYNKLELFKMLIQYCVNQSVVSFISSDRQSILKELKRPIDHLQLEEVLCDHSIKILTNDKHKMKQFVENHTGYIQLVERLHDNILTYTDRKGRNILHRSADDVETTRYILDLPDIQQVINKGDKFCRTSYWYVINKKCPGKGKVTMSDRDRDEMIQLYRENQAVLYESSGESVEAVMYNSSDDDCEEEEVEVIYDQTQKVEKTSLT